MGFVDNYIYSNLFLIFLKTFAFPRWPTSPPAFFLNTFTTFPLANPDFLFPYLFHFSKRFPSRGGAVPVLYSALPLTIILNAASALPKQAKISFLDVRTDSISGFSPSFCPRTVFIFLGSAFSTPISTAILAA